jgi:hypothetical protein
MPASKCGKRLTITEPSEVVTPMMGRLMKSMGSWKLMAW